MYSLITKAVSAIDSATSNNFIAIVLTVYLCCSNFFCPIFSYAAEKAITGKGRIDYGDGNWYEGEFKKGKRDGFGKIVWNGDIYEGEFKNGYWHGKGKITYENGNWYEGEFKKGKRDGFGKIVWNEEIYEGDFKNDLRHGKGKITYENGNWYEGEFKKGKRDGFGKIVWNEEIYEGDFKNDLRHGNGKLVYPNGDSYTGEFKNGKLDGNVVVKFKRGGKIKGTFKENRYHGLISYQYPNNKIFTGFYIYGKLQNQGIYTWSNHKEKISFWFQEEKYKIDIIREVESLLLSSDFTRLEKIALDLRETKSMFSDGNWKLKFFYDGIASNERIFRDEDWKFRLQILKKWCGAQPESITAHVALAHFYVRYAWFARGTGWTTSVSDDHRKLFNERLKQAVVILNKSEKLEDTCPFYWSVYQTTALGLSFDRARYENIFSKAISVEPSNYIYFFQKAKYLLNRWYGEDGEWERFALTVADSTGGKKGDILYAQIVWYIMTYYNLRDQNTRIDWDRVHRGFDLIHSMKLIEPNQGPKNSIV